MTVATISSKGWIVIPNELRKKYRLREKRKAGVFTELTEPPKEG